MLTVGESRESSRTLGRRGCLRAGALALGGLTLPKLLQLRAHGASRTRSQKSVIMVYLHGGPPHLDMFDMKPDAPAEIRGEFQPIRTAVPGLEICELMPKLATVADKLSVIRNLSFLEYPLTDLAQRGRLDEVAVVVWGEMGRTPRINGNGAGRDHWNEVGFGLVAGGGLKAGQVIGQTTRGAERAVGNPYTPSNMLATLYDNVLGINPAWTYPNFAGRPLYVLDNRDKIRELV